MSIRSRLEGLALVLALLLVVAFVGSAALGVRLHPSTAAASPDTSALASATLPGVDGTGIRVEVLNGSGKPGLARDATERLRAAGFDVVYFGNAPEPRGISLVLDRGGRAEAARSAARALAIPLVRSEPDAGRFVDVTVIVARDWPPTPPPVKESGWQRIWRGVRSAL